MANNSALILPHTAFPAGLSALLDALPEPFCALDREGVFTFVSRSAQSLWGLPAEALVGTPVWERIPEEEQALMRVFLQQRAEPLEPGQLETGSRRADGRFLPLSWSARWQPETQQLYCIVREHVETSKAKQDQQLQKEQQYRAYELSRTGWWEWDARTNEYTSSDEIYAIYGLSRSDYPVINREVYLAHVHPKDRERVLLEIQKEAILSEFSFTHRFIRPSGNRIYVRQHIHVQRNEQGRVVLINGTTKDITEQALAQIQARKSNRKLVATLECIQDGYLALDTQGHISYWNTRAEEILEKKREEVIGQLFWDEPIESLSASFYQACNRAVNTQTHVQFEQHLPSNNRWLEVNAYPNPDGLSVFIKDISQRKKREEELRISNERFEFVALATSDIVWDWNLETGQTFVNDSFTNRYGFVVNKEDRFEAWEENLHPDDRDSVIRSQSQALQNHNTHLWMSKYRFCKSDGSIAYVSDKAVIIRNSEGKAIRMVGSVRDITESRKYEEQERLAKERYFLLFEDAPSPKWIFDEATLRFVEVNKAACSLYGYTQEEFLCMTIADIRPQRERARLNQVVRELKGKRNARFRGLMKHQKKDGSLIDVELTSHAYKQNDRLYIVVVANDVTEKLQAQKQLGRAIIQTQEKERSAIGKELHDNVNQMLTTAKLYTQLADDGPGDRTEFLRKGVDLIQRSIDEIRGLSRALVSPTLSDFGFKETVEELANYFSDLQVFRLQLDCQLGEERLDRELKLSIYRIVQELLNNIVKYAQATEVKIIVHNRGAWIRVAVQDNGIGFDPNAVRRGIGLSNVRSRVAVHNGKVRIQSAPGEGTKVLMVFPVELA